MTEDMVMVDVEKIEPFGPMDTVVVGVGIETGGIDKIRFGIDRRMVWDISAALEMGDPVTVTVANWAVLSRKRHR